MSTSSSNSSKLFAEGLPERNAHKAYANLSTDDVFKVQSILEPVEKLTPAKAAKEYANKFTEILSRYYSVGFSFSFLREVYALRESARKSCTPEAFQLLRKMYANREKAVILVQTCAGSFFDGGRDKNAVIMFTADSLRSFSNDCGEMIKADKQRKDRARLIAKRRIELKKAAVAFGLSSKDVEAAVAKFAATLPE